MAVVVLQGLWRVAQPVWYWPASAHVVHLLLEKLLLGRRDVLLLSWEPLKQCSTGMVGD